MTLTGENCRTEEKPVPVPLCAPQISQGLTGIEPGPPRWALKVKLSLCFWSTTIWRRRGEAEVRRQALLPSAWPQSSGQWAETGWALFKPRHCTAILSHFRSCVNPQQRKHDGRWDANFPVQSLHESGSKQSVSWSSLPMRGAANPADNFVCGK